MKRFQWSLETEDHEELKLNVIGFSVIIEDSELTIPMTGDCRGTTPCMNKRIHT